jgi:RES domain-containing protein
MLPLPYRATEGRANPKGIPYLYAATDKKTAMSEMRSWVGDYLSVAEIKISSELMLVDCTKLEFRELRLVGLRPHSFESETWGFVNAAFSRPVTADDDIADYAPTQAIAESFRHAGYRGVKYRSSVGDGSNFVLFELSDVEVGPRSLHRTTKACYSFEESEGPDLSHEKFLDELREKRTPRRSE